MNRSLRSATTALCLLLSLLSVRAARADNALLVGVNNYTNLPDAQLRGASNDVQAMKDKLTGLGFTVTTLIDDQATRQGILDALDAMKAKNSGNERFVFYFSGHGVKAPDEQGCIIPSDAKLDSEDTVITRDELYAAVHAIPSSGRTIVLDSCFSGAMSRAFDLFKGLHPNLRSRSYDLFRTQRPVESVNKGIIPVVSNRGGICYYCACDAHQRAFEDDIDGAPRGVFTYYLANRLKSLDEVWQPVQTDVSVGVMEASRQDETPLLSAGFEARHIFSDEQGPPLPPHTQSIWERFNSSEEDPAHVTLDMTPNYSTVKINEQFHFIVTPKTDGYVILMELDTDGNVNVLYPQSKAAADAKVTANSPFRIAASNEYTVNKEGPENVKAILFTSMTDAQNLLDAFPRSMSVTRDDRGKSIVMVGASGTYTSTLHFDVSGQANP